MKHAIGSVVFVVILTVRHNHNAAAVSVDGNHEPEPIRVVTTPLVHRPVFDRVRLTTDEQLGLPDDVVDDLVKDIDETEGAYRAAMQRISRWQHLEPVAFRRKLEGYLQRRGFSYDVIREVWDRIVAEREEEE